MCAIVGYVGRRPACNILMGMEYRGYDSAGVALLGGDCGLTVRRRAGGWPILRRRSTIRTASF